MPKHVCGKACGKINTTRGNTRRGYTTRGGGRRTIFITTFYALNGCGGARCLGEKYGFSLAQGGYLQRFVFLLTLNKDSRIENAKSMGRSPCNGIMKGHWKRNCGDFQVA